MTDCFALLGEPRRPWLETEALKARFISISSPTHPDRVHGESSSLKQAATERYTDLNAAYACLREPRSRLQHLLELERSAKLETVQKAPPGMMDFFTAVSQICRLVDEFLAEGSRISSPLLKVQRFEKGFEWMEKLNALKNQLSGRLGELDEESRQMNGVWEEAPPVGSPARPSGLPLERLEQVHQMYSYLGRWVAQIQDRLVQLSL